MEPSGSVAAHFWEWRGRIGRRRYALWGIGLFFLKYNLDRIVVSLLAGEPWFPWSYLLPGVGGPGFWQLSQVRWSALAVAITSLPYIAVGIMLTQRRLRDAGWPTWLAPLFFLPFVNLMFFLALCLFPSAAPVGLPPPGAHGSLRRMFTFSSAIASASAAVALTVVLAVPLVALATLIFKSYGWGVFVGIPFLCGFLSSVLHATAIRRSWLECAGVGCLSILVTAILLILMAVEGVVCVLMAAPIALPLAILGSTAGYGIQNELWSHRSRAANLYGAAWLVAPLMLAAEPGFPREPSVYAVTTRMEIRATPQKVWRNVVSFSELPPPTEWVFRSGIAYPIHARIFGSGVGAVRHCEFSTGPFVEPITVWDEPRRLAFDVASQPAPMNELSPYHDLHPPHLDGFFRSRRGEFRLVGLPDGSTLLEGTTWYQQELWPAAYWRTWSDWLVHSIHERVLRHIKAEAEG